MSEKKDLQGTKLLAASATAAELRDLVDSRGDIRRDATGVAPFGSGPLLNAVGRHIASSKVDSYLFGSSSLGLSYLTSEQFGDWCGTNDDGFWIFTHHHVEPMARRFASPQAHVQNNKGKLVGIDSLCSHLRTRLENAEAWRPQFRVFYVHLEGKESNKVDIRQKFLEEFPKFAERALIDACT